MVPKNVFKSLILAFLLGYSGCVNALIPTNLFDPYDILLMRPVPRDAWVQFDITYEGAFNARPFQAVEESAHVGTRESGSVLQLWQDEQNVFRSFTNVVPDCVIQPPADDEFLIPEPEPCRNPQPDFDAAAKDFEGFGRSWSANLIPSANFKVPVNLMLAARIPITCDWTLGLYLPFYVVQLHNVCWKVKDGGGIEKLEAQDLLNIIENADKINIHEDSTRKGIGDFTALMTWFHDFQQQKRWLKNVMVGVRAGMIFPTGKAANPDQLFSLPLGHDGGVGFLFGGTLDLDIKHWFHFGIDAQFKHFFGSKHVRRFKIDVRQTDLLFLNKALTFKEPGFTQHYTLYLKSAALFDCMSATLAYQNTKHQEDRLTILEQQFDARVVNNAECLQEWTTHSLIGMLDLDFRSWENCWYIPAVTVFGKYGFRGHRSIVCNTMGVQLSIDF